MWLLVVGERRGWRDELREEIQWRREERGECMRMSLACFFVADKRRWEEGRDGEGGGGREKRRMERVSRGREGMKR